MVYAIYEETFEITKDNWLASEYGKKPVYCGPFPGKWWIMSVDVDIYTGRATAKARAYIPKSLIYHLADSQF